MKQNAADIVHGLDDSADDVATARETIHSAGSYGPVSVERFNGPHLPYADNMVNLFVAAADAKIPREEILRVLCPGGRRFPSGEADAGGRWRTAGAESAHEAVANDVDQWTHFLHDPSNNAVARDSEVGPPDRLQWSAEPL